MGNYTSKLNLYKIDPVKDGDETFEIKTMLNDNWDKVDNKVKSMSDKLDNVEDDANNYTHPADHSADMITVSDVGNNFSSGNVEDVLGEVGASLSAIANVIVADGTDTAITLNIPNVTDYRTNMKLTFIAKANNNGNATTININNKDAKNLYKPNTTTAPNLKTGKPYTVYYDGTNFFLQASAEGNALAEHVLAGKTFSNDDDTGIVGTMDLSNLKADNIKSGVNINGVLGNVIPYELNPGNINLAYYRPTVQLNFYTGNTWIDWGPKFTVKTSGRIRLSYRARVSWDGSAYVYFSKNNGAGSTQRTISGNFYMTYTEDINCNSGDVFQLKGCAYRGGGGSLMFEFIKIQANLDNLLRWTDEHGWTQS
ncbi:MAG: hypothetical protein N4A50_06315 [Vallitalea sp.]|jgi:hypothetical protein|nr:hypothetical protein [Vallitalea sp.]